MGVGDENVGASLGNKSSFSIPVVVLYYELMWLSNDCSGSVPFMFFLQTLIEYMKPKWGLWNIGAIELTHIDRKSVV